MQISDKENTAYAINSTVGIACGYSAYKYLPRHVKKPYFKYFIKQTKYITPDEHKKYWDSAIKSFKNSKVYNSALNITHIDKANWKSVAEELVEKRKQKLDSYGNNLFVRILKKLVKKDDKKMINHIKEIAQGKNACFIPMVSQVLVNSEKMGISTFHELGHSININAKDYRKALALSRAFSILALPIVLCIGLVTPKREEGDEYNNPIGKTATYIKEHCGLLAGLSLLPVVAEEGVASLNGAKLAKNVLSKDMYKTLNKFNTVAFGSYVLGALSAGVFAALSVYIKDKVSGTAPVREKKD